MNILWFDLSLLPNDGATHHMAMSRDGDGERVYIDGERVS